MAYLIFSIANQKPFLGVLIKTNHKSRRIIGFGSSCGNVVSAGHFKADYEIEVELNVIIQNESPYTVYEVDVSYAPNQYSEKYTLIDKRVRISYNLWKVISTLISHFG